MYGSGERKKAKSKRAVLSVYSPQGLASASNVAAPQGIPNGHSSLHSAPAGAAAAATANAQQYHYNLSGGATHALLSPRGAAAVTSPRAPPRLPRDPSSLLEADEDPGDPTVCCCIEMHFGGSSDRIIEAAEAAAEAATGDTRPRGVSSRRPTRGRGPTGRFLRALLFSLGLLMLMTVFVVAAGYANVFLDYGPGSGGSRFASPVQRVQRTLRKQLERDYREHEVADAYGYGTPPVEHVEDGGVNEVDAVAARQPGHAGGTGADSAGTAEVAHHAEPHEFSPLIPGEERVVGRGQAAFDPSAVLFTPEQVAQLTASDVVQGFVHAAGSWAREHAPIPYAAKHKVVPSHHPPPLDVLYPMGADYCNAFAVFPTAEIYLLHDQYPAGRADRSDVHACVAKAACKQAVLEAARAALSDLEKDGFVLPSTLARHSRSTPLGMLPILIASVLATNGKVVHADNFDVEGLGAASGIRLLVHQPDGEKGEHRKALVYLGVDALHHHAELQRFLRPRAPFATVIRSSGYVLHGASAVGAGAAGGEESTELNHLRAFLLVHSNIIVQDDSGLPFHNIRARFDVSVYGSYVGPGAPALTGFPDASLRKLYQQDLFNMTKSSASPEKAAVPFRFGYRERFTRAGTFVRDLKEWDGIVLMVARRPTGPDTPRQKAGELHGAGSSEAAGSTATAVKSEKGASSSSSSSSSTSGSSKRRRSSAGAKRGTAKSPPPPLPPPGGAAAASASTLKDNDATDEVLRQSLREQEQILQDVTQLVDAHKEA